MKRSKATCERQMTVTHAFRRSPHASLGSKDANIHLLLHTCVPQTHKYAEQHVVNTQELKLFFVFVFCVKEKANDVDFTQQHFDEHPLLPRMKGFQVETKIGFQNCLACLKEIVELNHFDLTAHNANATSIVTNPDSKR